MSSRLPPAADCVRATLPTLVHWGVAEKWIQHTTVAFGDVDRENLLLLRGVFKMLQEAAIGHANEYDTGTEAMVTRGESWVLNRMAVEIARYPAYGEKLRVETWSSGIRGFKGFRDFRIYDGDERVLVAGSSLWIYLCVRTKMIIRVPHEVAEQFPVAQDGVHCPDLESLPLNAPDAASARLVPMTLRYSDIDANDHLNNTAYLDLVQTALVRAGHPARPRRVRIKYSKGIAADTATVDVRLGSEGGAIGFSISAGDSVCAQGDVL